MKLLTQTMNPTITRKNLARTCNSSIEIITGDFSAALLKVRQQSQDFHWRVIINFNFHRNNKRNFNSKE